MLLEFGLLGFLSSGVLIQSKVRYGEQTNVYRSNNDSQIDIALGRSQRMTLNTQRTPLNPIATSHHSITKYVSTKELSPAMTNILCAALSVAGG